MIIAFFIITLLIVFALSLSRTRKTIVAVSSLYYIAQTLFAIWIITSHIGAVSGMFFAFDNLGVIFHLLLVVISPMVFYQSINYLDSESPRDYKFYNICLILLSMAVTGVYYADNIAVTWIFLEATTLATAGLVYHRRTIKSLEATWKYIFVSSVGIAIAYLGILLLSTAVVSEENLSYATLTAAISSANPLYIKLGFLFILLGYSCKLEIFPLYTVGVDANYTSPTPASALISTALVNAGFVAFFRVFRIISYSDIYPWASNVLIVAGIISVLIGAVYLRRTNNYKRFLTYSTVENMGVVMIGLGVGGMGVFAAIFHLVIHSLIKSGMFMQIAQIGRLHGTYRINRIGNYLNTYRLGGAVVILGLVGLLAFPPSGLFVSELMILREIIASGRWLLLVVFVLLVCLIIYTLCRRLVGISFKQSGGERLDLSRINKVSTYFELSLLLCAMILGIVQPRFLVDFINAIIL